MISDTLSEARQEISDYLTDAESPYHYPPDLYEQIRALLQAMYALQMRLDRVPDGELPATPAERFAAGVQAAENEWKKRTT